MKNDAIIRYDEAPGSLPPCPPVPSPEIQAEKLRELLLDIVDEKLAEIIVTALTEDATDEEIPSARAVWGLKEEVDQMSEYAEEAAASAAAAAESAEDAETAQSAAEDAAAAAASSATAAAGSATAAAGSATDAASSATDAAEDAAAANSAKAAAQAAQAAAEAAVQDVEAAGAEQIGLIEGAAAEERATLSVYADLAAASATAADALATAADASATAAAGSASDASASATAADESADAAAESATAADASAEAAAASAATFETDPTLSTDGKAADAKAAGDKISELKTALGSISDIPTDVFYVTEGVDSTHNGVTYYKSSNNTLALYGNSVTAAGRANIFIGKNQYSVTGTQSPSKNVSAGVYTIFATGITSGKLELLYTESTYNAGVAITNGSTLTVGENGGCLFALIYKNKNFGTSDNPTLLTVHLFEGITTGDPTAIDTVARENINNLKADVNKVKKFVATTGNDTNDGDTPQTPYATIGKAISETPDIIYVAKGTYTEAQIYENKKLRYSGIRIICDNATLIMPVSGIQFRYANVDISGLTVDVTNASGESSYGFFLLNCTGKMTDCTAIGAKGAGGFRLDGSKVTLTRCVVANCAIDGFNGHTVNTGYETEVTLIDCIAQGCGDDGASIHESGKMYVIGGEYYNNVQAGLAPHDLCVFEALNVHCHHNGIGIEAVKDTLSTGETPAVGRVIGCILDHNTTYGLDVKNYTVNALGNAYANNGTDKTRTGTGATINAFTAD